MDTVRLVRAVVFLLIPGILWPKPTDTTTESNGTPLGGMTTIGWDHT